MADIEAGTLKADYREKGVSDVINGVVLIDLTLPFSICPSILIDWLKRNGETPGEHVKNWFEAKRVKPPTDNGKRNKVAKEWIEKLNPNLSGMTNQQILDALKLFSPDNKSLFINGGGDWLNRDHSVIPRKSER